MKDRIKVIVKMPHEDAGHIEVINNDLHSFQTLVGGYIETVSVKINPEDEAWMVAICNEEGLISDLPYNCNLFGYDFFGTIILAGVDGEDFTDVPISLKNWKCFMEVKS